MNIKPLGDRVLVEALEAKEQVKGGIFIPDSAKEKPQEAKVVALGTGKNDDKGNKIPFEVKVGDIVIISKYGGTEIKYDDKEYKILNSDDIQAVVCK
ncbi:MAG TPA: co-chaperone GroES [Lentisphaeria bacterium]|nr:MAG: co-chaperone GroES [Lentisphaerae bacterium GWF2_38_69]HBM16229.1 co-chaperone GroES [Lentisphaeria bacterium]